METAEAKRAFDLTREAFIIIGLIGTHPNEFPAASDVEICRNHIGPATTGESLARAIKPIYEMPKPIMLPDDTLRDHVNDLVMQVLAREKAKEMKAAIDRWEAIKPPQFIQYDPLPEQPTLRDKFAMAALGGLIFPNSHGLSGAYARDAYLIADAMIEVRKTDAADNFCQVCGHDGCDCPPDKSGIGIAKSQ